MERLVYFTGDVALVDNLGIEECMEIQEPLKKLHDYEIAEEQGLLTKVVYGEWIDTEPEYHNGYYRNAHKCSNCQDYYTTEYGEMIYCPNCGAKMKTKEEAKQMKGE